MLIGVKKREWDSQMLGKEDQGRRANDVTKEYSKTL